MGLDMYLTTKKYVSDYDFSPTDERHTYNSILKLVPNLAAVASKGTPSLEVAVTVGYWRKANAIHAWFVKNVQKGVDECQESYVDKDELRALVNDAKEAFEAMKRGDTKAAEAILPPQAGFFFGSTDMDEEYTQDLQDTIAQLTPLLELEGVDFYYRSSW